MSTLASMDMLFLTIWCNSVQCNIVAFSKSMNYEIWYFLSGLLWTMNQSQFSVCVVCLYFCLFVCLFLLGLYQKLYKHLYQYQEVLLQDAYISTFFVNTFYKSFRICRLWRNKLRFSDIVKWNICPTYCLGCLFQLTLGKHSLINVDCPDIL